MYTKEELGQRYQKFSDQQLLGIVYKRENYTEHALEAAYEEIKRRNLSLDDLQTYYDKREEEKTTAEELAAISLTEAEKALWYFIMCHIPFLGPAIKRNYAEDGHIKKLDQSYYYSLFGRITLFSLIVITTIFKLNPIISIFIWFLCYGIEYRIRMKKSE